MDPKIFSTAAIPIAWTVCLGGCTNTSTKFPNHVEPVAVEAPVCPSVTFKGSNIAELYTNVYNLNMDDMAKHKVDSDGMTHTSTPGTANFGLYIGLGTFPQGVFLLRKPHLDPGHRPGAHRAGFLRRDGKAPWPPPTACMTTWIAQAGGSPGPTGSASAITVNCPKRCSR